jgi:hypothetical protein
MNAEYFQRSRIKLQAEKEKKAKSMALKAAD